jgi:hypothetical protein
MCQSRDPDGDDLEFSFDFGDGELYSGECSQDHTYDEGRFGVRVCVSDGRAPQRCHDYTVQSGHPEPYAVGAPRRLSWESQLLVPGGTAQVVFNGRAVSYLGEGRAYGALDLGGENAARRDVRVEAVLIEADGPGLWRFRLDVAGKTGGRLIEPGSLQAVAGVVDLQGPDTLVFRMKGLSGERVVFSFRYR